MRVTEGMRVTAERQPRDLEGRNRRVLRLLLLIVAALAVATLLAGIRW